VSSRAYSFVARVTSLNTDPEVDETIFGVSPAVQKFLNLGFLGALITTIVASIAWQVVASAFPIAFLGNPLTYILLRWCLFLEALVFATPLTSLPGSRKRSLDSKLMMYTLALPSVARVERNTASICVQRHVRSWLARPYLTTCMTSAIRIQANARKWNQQAQFALMRQSALTIQARWRGYQTRTEFAIATKAATLIQGVWRGEATFVNFSISYDNIIVVQTVARRFLSVKQASRR